MDLQPEPRLESRVDARIDLPRIVANIVLIALGILFAWAAAPRIGLVSRMTESMLSVADFTYAIWAFIFIEQIIYAFYQSQLDHHGDIELRRIGWYTALNGLLIGCWAIATANGYLPFAWILLIAVVVNLVIVEAALGEHARHGTPFLFVRTPFTVNLAWASFLLVLQTSTMLTQMIGYLPTHAAAVGWSVTMIILTACFAAFMTLWRRHPAYAFVVAWGLLGVAVYRVDVSPAVGIVAFVSCGLLALVGIFEIVAAKRGFDLRDLHFPRLHFGRARHA